MEKVTVTRVYRKNISTKFGEKEKTAIKTVEYGDRWISTLDSRALNITDGDVIECKVEEKGDFLNLILPKAEDLLLVKVEELEKRLSVIEKSLEKHEPSGKIYSPQEVAEQLDGKVVEDLPF